jgi:hypothetical protein
MVAADVSGVTAVAVGLARILIGSSALTPTREEAP